MGVREAVLTDATAGERVQWIDLFRAWMMFAIVWGHAMGVGDLGAALVNRYLYSFHVAAFFFVSGYMYSGTNIPFRRFAGKKCKSLLVPYYIFSLLSIGLFTVLGSVASTGLGVALKSTDILPNILGMLYGNGATGYMKWNLPLWFIPCLFAMNIVFYGVEKPVEALKKRLGVHTVMAGLFAASVLLAVLNYYVLKLKKLPFGLETVVYMLPFYIVGYWLRYFPKLFQSKRVSKLAAAVIMLCVGAVFAIVVQNRVDYATSRYENLLAFYVSAFCSVVGFALLARCLSCKWLTYMGKNTLPILLMHKFPIVFMQMFLGKYMERNLWAGVGISVAIAVVACTASIFAGQIITMWMPFVLGGKKKNEVPAEKKR